MVFVWFQNTNVKLAIVFFLILNNHFSSLQLRQNNMANLNECSLLNVEKTQQCRIQKLNLGVVANEHQYVTKITLCVMIGSLWGDFTAIFWIA